MGVACNAQTQNPTRTSNNATEGLRVVALEWVYVEDLLALGIQPVGVADIAGYKDYVNIGPQLAESVVDVGTRQEPSLDAIAQLEPDLILGLELRHQPILPTLSAIAQTQLFNPYPEAISQFEEMQQTFLTIAKACNQTAKAESVLEEMQTTLTNAAERLQQAGLKGDRFILGQFVPELRLFTDKAMAVQIVQQLGLENAWEGEENSDRFGFNTVGLENLLPLEKAHFLYVAEANQIPQQKFLNNPVWQNLAFVEQNRLHSLNEDTWLFGGPLSTQVLAEKVVTALTDKNSEDV